MVGDPYSLGLLLAALAGGAFGAAIGALPAFAVTGLLVIAGELLAIVRESLGSPGALQTLDVTGAIAFGPAFGPHVSFGGGAAAVAYAARRGYLDTDFDYHEAKHITTGLGSRPDVLAVGAVFGVVGHLVAAGSRSAGLPLDPVALGVVVSALVHRLAFGYSFFGAHPRRWLDMTPFERGERVDATGNPMTDGGRATGGRLRVEPWLPYQYQWPHVAALGVAVGGLAAYLAYVTASPFLAFGIAAASLLFIVADVDRIPVTHHMALPASTVVLALVPGAAGGLSPTAVAAAVPLWQAIALGAVAGLVGALVGEVLQRIFYAHAATHLDPPAASIVVTSLGIAALALAGVLESAVWVPLP
jgi:hypothetical protein